MGEPIWLWEYGDQRPSRAIRSAASTGAHQWVISEARRHWISQDMDTWRTTYSQTTVTTTPGLGRRDVGKIIIPQASGSLTVQCSSPFSNDTMCPSRPTRFALNLYCSPYIKIFVQRVIANFPHAFLHVISHSREWVSAANIRRTVRVEGTTTVARVGGYVPAGIVIRYV